MKLSLTIEAVGLDEKDIVVLKSALGLRSENWIWTSAGEADILVVAAERVIQADPADRPTLIVGEAPAQPLPMAEVIGKPLKAIQLMRALDRLLARRGAAPAPAVRATPAAKSSVTVPSSLDSATSAHPWAGRKVRLLKAPSLSKYPVTAEMIGLIHSISHASFPYEALLDALPLDRDLLNAILDDAAHHGQLVDESGSALPPLTEQKGGLMGRLFGKH